jgi:hypothetical protein
MNVKKAEIERDTNINTTTSKTIKKTTTNNAAALVDSSSVSIEIPSNLKNYAEQIVALTSCLEAALAQKVIDELSAGMADSSIKSPIGWLSNVVKKAQAGEFVPSKSLVRMEKIKNDNNVKNIIAEREAAAKANYTEQKSVMETGSWIVEQVRAKRVSKAAGGFGSTI